MRDAGRCGSKYQDLVAQFIPYTETAKLLLTVKSLEALAFLVLHTVE